MKECLEVKIMEAIRKVLDDNEHLSLDNEILGIAVYPVGPNTASQWNRGKPLFLRNVFVEKGSPNIDLSLQDKLRQMAEDVAADYKVG